MEEAVSDVESEGERELEHQDASTLLALSRITKIKQQQHPRYLVLVLLRFGNSISPALGQLSSEPSHSAYQTARPN